METNVSKIKENELNSSTYPIYCNLYLIQKIYEEIPSSFGLLYSDVAHLINAIDESLYDSLNTETSEIILLNQVYSLFMQNDIELDREFLYELVHHLYNLYPEDEYTANPYDEQWNLFKESEYYKELEKEEEEKYEFYKRYF